MGLISFDEALKSPPTGSIFVADTSFIVKSLAKDSKEHDFRNKFAGKVGFVYNVVIRNEMLHYTRLLMMADAIENEKISVNKNVRYIWEAHDGHDRLKALCDAGYAEMFREVLGAKGENLEAELEKAFTGFTYANGKRNSRASSWDQVLAIMAIYGLDSSDAMIVNFAAGDATYAGIITSDRDYRVCGDVISKYKFDIILPKGAKNWVAKKEWRPQTEKPK